ncbi:MAG TPA: tetratricopeptide repeat protein [Bryobacteraceae bacterium]|jgi:predicted Zn-dependent protease
MRIAASFAVAALSQLAASLLSAQAAGPAAEAERARQLVVSGKPGEAIPIYLQLVRAYPSSPDLLFNLCIAEFQANRYRDAADHARAALELKPDLAPADLFLGSSYLALGEDAKAVEPLRKAVSDMPGDRNAPLALGEALLGSRQYEEALAQFRSSSERMPESARAWYGLGRTYDALAGQAADQVKAKFPDSAYASALAGDAYLKQRRYGSAFAAYREALARGPVLPGVHAGLARVYKETGHAEWVVEEQAWEDKLPPATKSDTGPAAYYWSSKSYRELAAQAYERLLHLPPSLESQLHRARSLDDEGRHREASAEWRTALKRAPGNMNVQRGLAWALYESRDYDSALPVVRDMLKESPESADANFLYGASLLNLAQPHAAVPYLQTAIKEDPQMQAAESALGQALLGDGHPEQAIPYLKAAVLHDEDGNAHFQLFRAYQLTGNSLLAREALAAYRQFRTSLDQQRKIEEGSQIKAP